MTDTFLQQLAEKMAERLCEIKLARKPNTFSVFLRKGAGIELEFEPWVYEEVSSRSSLPSDWSDHTTEFEFRSHRVLWEVEKEYLYSVNRENREFLKNRDDRQPLPPLHDTIPEYTYQIVENIPLSLKPYTHILDFQSWGETLYFDFTQMKSEALDAFIQSGQIEYLKMRYEEIQALQNQFPNSYTKDYNGKCVRVAENEPAELVDERYERSQHFYNLLESNEARSVIEAIEQFNARFPEDNITREDWNQEVSSWYESIQNQEIRNLVLYHPNRHLSVRWPSI